uniref:C2H2-type domain-containing protein n=1 Tax=Glossina austeni TaxID=7395 RepID=A0A1A9VG59_GLOAU
MDQILNPLNIDLTETSHVMNEFDVVALSLSEGEKKKSFKGRSNFLNEEAESDVNNRKLTTKKKICSPWLPVMETISLDSSASEDDTVIYDDSEAENNFKKLFANLAAETNIVQSQQQEEEVAVLTNLKNGNSEHSKNISGIVNKSIHGNEVHQNQSINNHSLAQSFTDDISIEELLASLESFNQGHQLEDFQLQPNIQTFQTQQKCKASTSEEGPHKNVINNYYTFLENAQTLPGTVIRNTIRPVNHLPSETNPIISNNFTPQTITNGLFPANFLNSNQYSTTNGIPHQFFYPANINTYMGQPNRAMQPKLNMSDPRVLKHMQRIQSSPLPSIVAANLQSSIPHFEFQRNHERASINNYQTNYPVTATALLQLAGDYNGQPRKSNNGSTGRRSSITYGEYKRRKAEEQKKNIDQLNEERERKEAEKQAKDTLAAQKIEKQELDKQQDQTRSIPHTKLKGQFQIRSILHRQLKDNEDEMQAPSDEYKRNSDSTNGTTNQTTNVSPTIQISGSPTLAKANNITETFLHTTSTVKANNETEQLRHPTSTAIDKVYKTLECTVKGYSQFEHFTPKLLGGKRRSSINARSIIAKQLDVINSPIKRNPKRKRHSDIKKDVHVLRTADSNDSNARTTPAPDTINRKHKYALESRQMNVNSPGLVEQQLLKEPGPFQKSFKQSHIDIGPTGCTELDVSLLGMGHPLLQNDGDGNITGDIKDCGTTNNNDYEMTELNTFFCVLCPSKPSDITNHYIRKHKTESYVSRLTAAKLNDLILRINFAEFQGFSDCHLARFKVTCPFCEDIIIHRFSSLYDHFSKHTGEYAYMCCQCLFNKPFRVDIQSHQQNSRKCRKANLRIVYRYPPNATVIYLYYCSICNYVQLNEANVFKHLREHHNPRETAEGNVQKCILTAIPQVASNTQICERTSSLTSTDSKSNEEMIDVLQKELKSAGETVDADERYAEDTEIKEEVKNPKLFQDHAKQNPFLMTVVHCPISTDASATITRMSSKVPKQDLPKQDLRQLIKCEEGIDDQLSQYSEPVKYTQCAPILNESRFTYRLLPANGTYLGLYKCMAHDCYFSSNKVEDILFHLKNHANSECRPIEYIQCAYCVLRFGECNTAEELIKHILLKHQYSVYQCSICSYRSCDASNVCTHQQLTHPYTPNNWYIYLCANQIITYKQKKAYLIANKAKYIQKISCPYCSSGFFATYHLQRHIELFHKISNFNPGTLKCFSCIYCRTSDKDQKGLRNHLALYHPSELPVMCDHNVTTDFMMDSVQSLKLVNLAVRVPPHLLKDVSDNRSCEDCQAVIPIPGVPSEELFRCPESTCADPSSLYESWLGLPKLRHSPLSYYCSHCPLANQLINVDAFETHFEKHHHHHIYIWFHCLHYFKYEDGLKTHAGIVHQSGDMRLEQIRYKLLYTYKFLIHTELCIEPMMSLSELLKVLDKKLKESEEIYHYA